MKKRTTALTCALLMGLGLGVLPSGCLAHTVRPSKTYVTEKKNTGSIHAVSTDSSIDVVYYQTSGKPYVEIYTADNLLPYIELKETKGNLYVRYKSNTRIMGENHTKVTVYAPSVSHFQTRASGDISIPRGLATQEDVAFDVLASGDISCGNIRCKDLSLSVNASGDVETGSVSCHTLEAKVNASGDIDVASADCNMADVAVNASGDCSVSKLVCTDEVQGTVNGSGDVSLKGKTPKARLCVSGSGDIQAGGLYVQETEATVNGSGDIRCRADKALKAERHGSGTIYYTGNPPRIEKVGKGIIKD